MREIDSRISSLKVVDIASKKVIGVSPSQQMIDVAALLLKHEISSAPVVDESGYCVGMISATDFLRRDAATRQQDNSQHTVKTARPADDVAGNFMTKTVQSIDAHATLLQAAKVICSQHIHRLPVVDHQGKLVGVVSTMDIVAALTNAVAETELENL